MSASSRLPLPTGCLLATFAALGLWAVIISAGVWAVAVALDVMGAK